MKNRITQLVSLIAVLLLLPAFFPSADAYGADKPKVTGLFDSMRDYISALEANGKLMRVKEVDQDKYEGTALIYRLLDKFGPLKAPAVLFEKVKVNGEWFEGPVLGNIYCGWDSAAMVFGVENITDDQGQMYRAVREKLVKAVEDNGGKWNRIKPVVTGKKNVPCKEIILKGDDVDMFRFPWFKNNPGDGGQYISSGAVFMEDPKFGRNVGTYRVQVKGKNKVGMNTEMGQHGWQFVMGAKRKGQKSIPAAIVMGADPIVFSMSATKVAGFGEDELEFAGGITGKPVELVKCETSGIMVPANAEMIIEGDVMTELEDEGPYGEMHGYMGRKHQNWYMNVKAITHRKNPLIINIFTGVTQPTIQIPWYIGNYINLKKMVPNLVDMYGMIEAIGISVISIDKKFPGQGIRAGEAVLSTGSDKVVIVVDKDIDVANTNDVLHAVATRWQPSPGSLIVPQTFSFGLDPSMAQRGLTSKIVIDATQHFAIEGGPAEWQPVSRVVLEEQAPESFGIVDKKWQEYLRNWKKE